LAAIYLPKLCLDLEIFYLKFYEQNDSFETENLTLPTLICSYFAHLTLPFQACEKFLLFENFLPNFPLPGFPQDNIHWSNSINYQRAGRDCYSFMGADC